eukprot:SAG11_NODE_245_length_11735_cov_3.939068_7_plen_66_part_00
MRQQHAPRANLHLSIQFLNREQREINLLTVSVSVSARVGSEHRFNHDLIRRQDLIEREADLQLLQ